MSTITTIATTTTIVCLMLSCATSTAWGYGQGARNDHLYPNGIGPVCGRSGVEYKYFDCLEHLLEENIIRSKSGLRYFVPLDVSQCFSGRRLSGYYSSNYNDAQSPFGGSYAYAEARGAYGAKATAEAPGHRYPTVASESYAISYPIYGNNYDPNRSIVYDATRKTQPMLDHPRMASTAIAASGSGATFAANVPNVPLPHYGILETYPRTWITDEITSNITSTKEPTTTTTATLTNEPVSVSSTTTTTTEQTTTTTTTVPITTEALTATTTPTEPHKTTTSTSEQPITTTTTTEPPTTTTRTTTEPPTTTTTTTETPKTKPTTTTETPKTTPKTTTSEQPTTTTTTTTEPPTTTTTTEPPTTTTTTEPPTTTTTELTLTPPPSSSISIAQASTIPASSHSTAISATITTTPTTSSTTSNSDINSFFIPEVIKSVSSQHIMILTGVGGNISVSTNSNACATPIRQIVVVDNIEIINALFCPIALT